VNEVTFALSVWRNWVITSRKAKLKLLKPTKYEMKIGIGQLLSRFGSCKENNCGY